MRKHLLLISLIMAWTSSPLVILAQSDSTPAFVRRSLWRIGLFNFVKPGLSYELGLSQKLSLISLINLRTDYTSNSQQNKPTVWYRSLVTQASLSARYYYNLENRLATRKNTRYNSGNYLSVGVYYTSPVVAHWGEQSLYSNTYPQGIGNSVTIRLMWGIQRQLPPRRLYYDLSTGLQVNTNRPNNNLQDALTAQLTVGYCLTK